MRRFSRVPKRPLVASLHFQFRNTNHFFDVLTLPFSALTGSLFKFSFHGAHFRSPGISIYMPHLSLRSIILPSFLVASFSLFSQPAIRLCKSFFRSPAFFHSLAQCPNLYRSESSSILHCHSCRLSFLYQQFPSLLYLTASPLAIMSDTSLSFSHRLFPSFS